jgi:hypothetical protein
MKTTLSALAAAGALSAAGFIASSSASAQSHYRASQADYRVYCEDDGYYDRYEWYCSRFDRDDDNDYDDVDDTESSSYDTADDIYYDVQSSVRNSNYNHSRTYIPGYDSTDAYRTDGGDSDQDDDDADGYYDSQTAVTGRTRDNTGGGQGNDSNSYTGQRSTTR